MFHQTHHFHPFLLSSTIKPTSSSFSLVEKGGGIMGRIIKEEDVTTSSSSSSVNNNNVADNTQVDFFVDQLLNLNNNDDHIQPQQNPNEFHSVSQLDFCTTSIVDEDKGNDTPFLSPPLDTAEEANLEWLSQFVDDSFLPYSTPYPPGYSNPKPEPTPNSIELKPAEENASPLSLKRARRRKRVWTVPESESYYDTPTITSHSQGTKRRKQSGSGTDTGMSIQRRCSHCGVQKTPQWRQGPNGETSLCNACGVRFRSGRLHPEYRSACSPTFSSEFGEQEEEADLEWLSQFVDDSCCPYSTPYPPGYHNPKPEPTPNSAELKQIEQNKSPLSLRGAQRRKRVWTVSEFDKYYYPPTTASHSQGIKRRKQPGMGMDTGTGIQRRCSHCGVQKTPQWRQGPNGEKSLCNACGVRFKSGRLLPEYRPACSPTFSSELHSNSHRKVMEMRMKKNGHGSRLVGSGLV